MKTSSQNLPKNVALRFPTVHEEARGHSDWKHIDERYLEGRRRHVLEEGPEGSRGVMIPLLEAPMIPKWPNHGYECYGLNVSEVWGHNIICKRDLHGNDMSGWWIIVIDRMLVLTLVQSTV